MQEAFEYKFLDIIELTRNEQYDGALACLDEILEANHHRDHDGWLARSIARNRVMILLDADRYAEAERACEAWEQIGIGDVCDRWMYANLKADILDALGRTREALEVLEEARSHRDPKYLPSAMLLLVPVVELSEKLGEPVDPKWRSLAEAVAKRYRTELPAADSLGKAILELDEITRTRNPKFPHEWKKDEAEDGET
ncbi:hypothetical protein [Polyangium aurulentum]|uniref:hypothetical protein n=1 Tax=Polyangium aurulentum TaxID=2567896 RepID=UPI00200C713F|nr:hypothetical protein [Polyangium aurulentum]UQA58645.1 hypothetical protein E8A73_046660 [Polyangium aurulentum]